MPQKFFENTLENKFIKALIRETPIPVIPTARNGDFIVKGCSYIYRSNIITCTKSGILDERLGITESICSENLCVSNSGVYVSDGGIVTADYREIDFFRFGKKYPNITENYISRYAYYDADTHYQLGQLLRCIRDLLHINLMPFYNCFSSKSVGFGINEGVEHEDEKTKKIERIAPFYTEEVECDHKTYIVPIKFNRKYTVAIDSARPVKLKAVMCRNGKMLLDSSGKAFTDELSDKTMIKGSTSFKSPFIYEIRNSRFELQTRERDLYLAIQLHNDVKSSIVVLEGDYTDDSYKVFNHEYIDELTHVDEDKLFISPLSLLKLNDGVSYAFSDRLVEYLLLNVITYQDEIADNIKRVQEYITDKSKKQNYIKVGRYTFMPYRNASVKGVWDVKLRSALYDIYMSNGSNKFDINGYVDKDVEKLITKGFDV